MLCECVCRETWEDPSPGLKTKINHVFYTLHLCTCCSFCPFHLLMLFFPVSSLSGKDFFFQNTGIIFSQPVPENRINHFLILPTFVLCILLSPASSTTVPSPTDIYLTWSTSWARRGEEWCIRISGRGSGGLQDWSVEHDNRFRGSKRNNVSHEIFRFIERELQFCIVLFLMSGLVVRQMCKWKCASCCKSIHKVKK